MSNAFLAANSVPNLTYSAVAGPVLALVVVPTVVRTILERGQAACVVVLRRLSGMLITASGVVALVLVVVAPALAWTLTVGIADADATGPGAISHDHLARPRRTSGRAVRGGRAGCRGTANARAVRPRGRSARAREHRPNRRGGRGRRPPPVGHGCGRRAVGRRRPTGCGATASVATHAAIQVFGAARAGMSIRPAAGWHRDAAVREVVQRLRGSVAVAALPAAGMYLLLAVASTVRGGVWYSRPPTSSTACRPRSGRGRSRPRSSPACPPRRTRTTGPVSPRRGDEPSTTPSSGGCCRCACWWRSPDRWPTLSHGVSWTAELVAALALCIAVLGVAQLACGMHEIARQALLRPARRRRPATCGRRVVRGYRDCGRSHSPTLRRAPAAVRPRCSCAARRQCRGHRGPAAPPADDQSRTGR